MRISYLVKKTFFLLGVKLAAALCVFLYHYLLIKTISISEYALFSLASSCLIFIVVLPKLGMEQSTIRFFSRQNEQNDSRLYASIIVFSGLVAFLIALLVYYNSKFIADSILGQPKLFDLMPLVAVLTISQTWLGLNSSALKGKKYPTVSLCFTGLITFSCAIILFYVNKPVDSYDALLQVASCSIFACFVSFLFTLKILRFRLPKKIYIEQSFVSASGSLLLISLAALITQQLAILVLGYFGSLDTVGIFSVALRISMLVGLILLAINSLTSPYYAHLYSTGRLVEFKRLAVRSTILLSICASLTVGLVLVYLQDILMLFGAEYKDAGSALMILLIGQWINLSTGSVVSMLIMSGHEALHRRNILYLSIFSILSLLYFTPKGGIIAAAMITSGSMAAKNLISLYYVYRLIYAKKVGDN